MPEVSGRRLADQLRAAVDAQVRVQEEARNAAAKPSEGGPPPPPPGESPEQPAQPPADREVESGRE